MSEHDRDDAPKPKNVWDKADVVLRPVGGMLTALSVALVGYFGTRALETGRAVESNVRLYAELMSAREEADSQLRQGMFNTIMSRFLTAGPGDTASGPLTGGETRRALELDVLRLEMLAYNFHDSLDLAPLFKDVHRRLIELGDSDDLLRRLERVANEVIDKQISSLDEETNVVRGGIGFDRFDAEGAFIPELISKRLSYHDGVRTRYKAFAVDVLSIDRVNQEIGVRLTVWDADDESAPITSDPVADVTFGLGYFDFPLVDNTRLGDGERCALVLSGFGAYEATLTLVYFPGSRASLKEKQFYDDIVLDLRRSQGMTGAAP